MPLSRTFIIYIAIAALSISCSKEESDPLPPLPEFEMVILNLNNHIRLSIGLKEWKMDSVMCLEARRHSSDMGLKLVPVDHDGFEARVTRINAALGDGPIAESVAMSYEYGKWPLSPEDLEKIKGSYNHIGIGIVEGKDGYYYITQIFMRTFP